MPALLLPNHILSLPAEAADRLLAQGSGDAALLYLALLRHDGWESARRALGWTDQRASEAFALLVKLGLAQGDPVQEAPPRPADQPPSYQRSDLMNALREDSTFAGVTQMVESMLGKTLSEADLLSLYTIYDYLALPGEVICMLTQACVADTERKYGPGRKPRMPMVKKTAFQWKRLGVDTPEAADAHLKRQALYRSREGEILRLLDQRPRPLVEKERKKVAAWTDMGFPDEALRLAYEKTVYKKQAMDWDYMNGILTGWHRKNLHTLAEIEAGDRSFSRGPDNRRDAVAPPAAGEADQRVRADLERMREFMRRQRESEGG